jgi:hypothetical protein
MMLLLLVSIRESRGRLLVGFGYQNDGGATKDILVVVISIGRDHSEIMSLFKFLNYSHFVVRFPNMVHKGRFLLDRSRILHGIAGFNLPVHMDAFTVIAVNDIK